MLDVHRHELFSKHLHNRIFGLTILHPKNAWIAYFLDQGVCEPTKKTGKFHTSSLIMQENALFSGQIFTAGKQFAQPQVATVVTNF